MLCVLCLLNLTVKAAAYHKREVERPCFVTANTTKIEFRKIILTDEQTQVDALLFGQPGDSCIVASDTYLRYAGGRSLLREAEGVSIGGTNSVPVIGESGKQYITLSFAPLPAEVHTVDFVEPYHGWNIYDVQLVETEPYVFIPEFLQTQVSSPCKELPHPELKAGKAIINGYILGYEERMDMDVVFRFADWLLANDWGQSVKIRSDGSFHIEQNLVIPCGAKIQINRALLNLFLYPGEEITVYIHLPRLSMSASHLLGDRYRRLQKAWYDGAGEELNVELATWGYPLSVSAETGYEDATAGLSDDELQSYINLRCNKLLSGVKKEKKAGEGYRDYVTTNLQINSAVLAGAAGRVDPSFKDSPFIRFGYDYVPYLQYLERDENLSADLWGDIKRARSVYHDMVKYWKEDEEDKRQYAAITQPELKKYIDLRANNLRAVIERSISAKRCLVAEWDSTLTGEDILPAIIGPHKGKAILVDFWATWCAPCRKSMHFTGLLKKKLPSDEMVYIYVTGPSSPSTTWRTVINEINGIHYRVTERQWDDLCKLYDIKGIPAYLIVNIDGEIHARYVGFPGVGVLEDELRKAMQ